MDPKKTKKWFLKVAMVLGFFVNGQELVLNEGIYMEKPLKNDTARYKYSLDNISYKLNPVFVFDYYYLGKDGKKKKFLHSKDENSRENPMNLVDFDDKREEVIGKVKMEVNDLRDFVAMGDADYTQTVFSYVYLNGKGMPNDTLCDFLKKKKKKIDLPAVKNPPALSTTKRIYGCTRRENLPLEFCS